MTIPGNKAGKVSAYSHKKRRRKNLPTDQTEPNMPDQDKAAESYTPPVRDVEHGSPLLSWHRGVDSGEIDELEAHPLYIHEKVSPIYFVESLAQKGGGQLDFYNDFNDLPENAAYEWYKHSGNWQNRIIRGDSSRIMSSLIQKEGMSGKVRMVYFDPPYGISFKSNFQTSTTNNKVGESAKDIPNEPAVISCFRDSYNNGINSYLDCIRRNAILARELLADDGSIFLQIGPENVHRIALVLDEVFGPENRVATISFQKSGGTATKRLPLGTDYLLYYAKNKRNRGMSPEDSKPSPKYHQLYELLTRSEKINHFSSYVAVEEADGTCRRLSSEERHDVSRLPDSARLYGKYTLISMGGSNNSRTFDYEWNGKTYRVFPGNQWRVSKEGLDRLSELNRLDGGEGEYSLRWKWYEEEVPGRRINNLWSKSMPPNDLHYVVETAESVIERCILMSTDPGDLVLDITCGSGTTAHVAEKWGRRWITTDTSGVAVSLCRQRIATGTYDYYLLADSKEGALKEAELSKKKTLIKKQYSFDVSKGFVYNRVPRVSAGILAKEEDEIEDDEKSEIDKDVLLVNHPVKSKGVLRVSSPFTVESESPYRYIPSNMEHLESRRDNLTYLNQMAAIKSALETTGISGHNLTEGDKLRLKDVSEWIPSGIEEASGSSQQRSPITHIAWVQSSDEEGGEEERVAIAIAPDDVTVSPAYINRAEKDALKIIDSGVLVIVAFAFESTTRDEAHVELRGKIKVLKAQANRDLLIGSIRDTSTDHAFVLIGEPDVNIEKTADGKYTVEVLGFDTYDPASGNVKTGTIDDIDCWMVDSDYDGKSFFVKHLHFPKPNDKQIKRLGKKLKKVSEEAWSAMLSNKSLPFDKPSTGMIAVRIVSTTHTEMNRVIYLDEE